MSEGPLRFGHIVIAKEHVQGRLFRAVVMDSRTNHVMWRAPRTGWTRENRELCREYIEYAS